MPYVSVVVPTHDRAPTLRTTLQRLCASRVEVPWEVVVVANACRDDTVAVVEEMAAGSRVPIRLIEEPRPGASVARNRGAAAATGDLLVFLDDDMLVEPDALGHIVSWFAASDGTSLLVGQALPMPEHLANPIGVFKMRLGNMPLNTAPHEIDWYASNLAGIDASTFEALGGYAECYAGAGLEDVDLAVRARRAHKSIVLHPGVVAFHNDWAGTTARDYCRRNALYCAQGPLLAERFPEGDHSWRQVIEGNRPSRDGDPIGMRCKKGVKLAAVTVGADRWLPAVADAITLPQRPRERLYRACLSLAMFAGYRHGLRELALGRLRPSDPPEAGDVLASSAAAPLSVARPPLSHRIAWRLGESSIRGKSRIGYLLQRLSPAPQGLVRLPSGQVVFHSPSDYVSHSIYVGGYELAERWVMSQVVRQNGVVVDVGANVGSHTFAASDLVGPDGHVIAIEPGPALVALEAALEAAELANVRVVPFAMGAAEGPADLRVPTDRIFLASLRSSCQAADLRPVWVTRLDKLDVPPGEIDLLKIDTEGYEAEVIEGAGAWLEAGRVRSILVEVSPEFGDIDYVGSICRRYGLAIFKIGYRKGLWYRPVLNELLADDVGLEEVQANYILIRADLVASLPVFQHRIRFRMLPRSLISYGKCVVSRPPAKQGVPWRARWLSGRHRS